MGTLTRSRRGDGGGGGEWRCRLPSARAAEQSGAAMRRSSRRIAAHLAEAGRGVRAQFTQTQTLVRDEAAARQHGLDSVRPRARRDLARSIRRTRRPT